MIPKIVASIQARMASSRLPGKVLLPVQGKPFLLWQVERVRRSRLIDEVVVATTESQLDDEVVSFCEEHEIAVFRGSEANVLGRVAALVEAFRADIHVELFGDSPLVDPQIVDEFIGYLLKNAATTDVVTNTLKTTYPPGFDFLVYQASSLLEVDRMLSSNDVLREHCGYNLSRFPEVFRIASLDAPGNLAFTEFNFELDVEEDYLVLCEIFKQLSVDGTFDKNLSEILHFARQNSHLFLRNSRVHRRWRELRG